MEGRTFLCQNTSVRPASPLSFYSLNIQLPPLRHSSASLRGDSASSHPGKFSHPAKKYGLTFHCFYCQLQCSLLCSEAAGTCVLLRQLLNNNAVITGWLRRKPRAQINDSDLIWTRQLRPLVKVSLFCWGLIQARERKSNGCLSEP